MPAAAKHRDEIRRLAAVARTRLMGTPAEERFDTITRLARRMFGADLAAIDIVAEDRVWIKSVLGAEVTAARREETFCQHAVLGVGLCHVSDARLDPRLADLPSAQVYAFYAGAPLMLEGQPVGVLCIAGREPRTLSQGELFALQDLAGLAENELRTVAMSEVQLELAAAAERMAEASMVDGLTRVWNRSAILELATRELATPPLSLVVLDVDHFKSVNDTYGHGVGDVVLREVSARVRRVIRPTDAVGRLGGEEFLVVLPQTDQDQAMMVAERLRVALSAALVETEGASVRVTASFGVAQATALEPIDAVVERADAAMYRAKRAGRNRVSH